MKNRTFILLTMLLLIPIILNGCIGKPEEKIYKKLEDVVKLEEVFKNEQKPLVKLEQQEKKLYDQMIESGYKEHDKIIKLADKAIELSEKRKEHLNTERGSIVAAEKNFKTVEKQIEKLNKPSLKKEGQELYSIMMERYKVHERLYDKYRTAIRKDQNLYAVFKDKHATLEQIQTKIDDTNRVYQQVYELNNQFNKLTERYNKMKIKFYEDAGLKKEKNENNILEKR